VNCQETQALLHAYVDGELALDRHLEVERHLEECSECARGRAELEALRATLRDGGLYHAAPAGLARRMQAALGRAPAARSGRRGGPRRWLAVAAVVFCVVVVGGWGLTLVLAPRTGDDALVRQLAAAHVRSQLLPTHRVDQESSDRHVVKPWFEGKVDFAPPVCDLGPQGFILVGGRLDYLDERPVAALVYQRRKHFINLFVWPAASGGESAPRTATYKGFRLVHWTEGGLTFWAVSDLEAGELQEFARLFREQAR
jgi:anti-sigma factor RsiW